MDKKDQIYKNARHYCFLVMTCGESTAEAYREAQYFDTYDQVHFYQELGQAAENIYQEKSLTTEVLLKQICEEISNLRELIDANLPTPE